MGLNIAGILTKHKLIAEYGNRQHDQFMVSRFTDFGEFIHSRVMRLLGQNKIVFAESVDTYDIYMVSREIADNMRMF